MSTPAPSRIACYELLAEASDFRRDLVVGLSESPKAVSPKYLYDKRGSELFDAECRQPEYYVPDCEQEIYDDFGTDIAHALGSASVLIEPGSGASRKVRTLLDNMDDPAGYVAIDISTEFMQESVESLAKDYPDLPLACVSADFSHVDRLPEPIAELSENRTVFFPGGTIGNLGMGEAHDLLTSFGRLAGPNGKLLVGVDLKKPREVLESAYRDAAGIADEFHLNLLQRANSELGADFKTTQFDYETFYNESAGRMEMYLVSTTSQQVTVDGRSFSLDEGERIRTQYSYKYTLDEFQGLAAQAGWTSAGVWVDSRGYFSTHLLATQPN